MMKYHRLIQMNIQHGLISKHDIDEHNRVCGVKFPLHKVQKPGERS